MISRLKSLELHGFKTFATRTEFAFAGAITAIVGPNGSGKSNVADAIRWVLGEQSYSLLRAKKTEDMIFSGSEQRSRAGMASATIVFDNADGWLPIDFSEVAINRRAYRDGQNEYFLNSQRVRLKDIAELLAQSGLAERTYTIIGQGLVDAALSLKAEERRRLFEEAAGIGLHRTRREEALRRLETTHRNLERVEDILAELQPRLRSLERQNRRVAEYDQVKADLNVLLRDWYGFHWRRAQRDLTDSQEAARLQEAGLERSRLAQTQLSAELTALQAHIHILREQLGGWHRNLSELHTRREQISRELMVSQERLRSLAAQRQNADSEQTRLEEEAGLQQAQLSEAHLQADHLKTELKDARSQAQTALLALQARQAERSQAEQHVQAARQESASLTARQAHLSARLSERKTQLERQQVQLEENLKAAEQAAQETQKFEAALAQAARERQAAETGLVQVEQRQAEQRTRLDQLESERRSVIEQRGKFQASHARLQAQLEVLQQAERSLAGYASGARFLLQAAQQSRLRGALGALSSLLETPAQFETAIAAALGDYLDAILIQQPTDLEAALNLLETSQSDGALPAALLPLGGLRAEEKPASLPDAHADGALGLALEHIQPAQGNTADLGSVFSLLLSRVLLVQDRQDAYRWVERLRAQNHAGWRVITLRGEVFHTSGPVLARQSGKSGTLSRPRQRRELQASLAEVQRQAAEAEAALQTLDAQVAEIRQAEPAVRRAQQEAQQALKTAQQRQNQAELALEKARRSYDFSHNQASRLQQDLQRAAGEITQMGGELTGLDAQIEAARQEQRLRANALAALTLDEFQTQVTHWNTRTAVANQALSAADKRQSELQAALERAQRARQALQSRMQEFETQAQELKDRQVSATQAEQILEGEIAALQENIRPVEGQLGEVEASYTRLQTREAEARQSLSLAEHQNAQARINLARRQESLESLRRRVEDDFGLVAFRYAENISGPTPLPLDGMVEQLPVVEDISPELEENIKRQRAQLRRIGPVNPEIQSEYAQVKERFTFLTEQVADLKKAQEDLREVIAELDLLMEREFRRTFDAVAVEFRQIFSRLFGGGAARLVLTEPDDMADTGIDIEARLPGRREQGLSLLSGGERSLTAAALVFALLKVSPTPFCLLDEVDAMLDEANVGRFREQLRELSQHTQFVIVTHNRNTVQAADVIYGVTMGPDSTSQVISLKLDQIPQLVD
jgi:chromosome segregation protein